jgi:hypothetical protein
LTQLLREVWDVGCFTGEVGVRASYVRCFFCGLIFALSSGPGAAETFVGLTDALPNYDLTINGPPISMSFTLPASGAGSITHGANAPSGGGLILGNFTFSGNYVLTVDAFGLQSDLANSAEAGLRTINASNGALISQIYSQNNVLGFSTNLNGASVLSDINVAPGEEQLTIAGYSSAPLYFGVFLIQNNFDPTANTVTFENLNLVADNFQNFAPPVPESSTWVMLLIGFAGVGLAAAYRRKNKIAPKRHPHCIRIVF